MTYSIIQADAIDWLWSLPADSVDLIFGSPPYEDARTYGIGFGLKGQAWVDWMVEVIVAASDACRGLVAFVVEGKTNSYRWSATPALLMADLHRRGLCLRKPPAFHRVGIPGSGGPDWLRNDYEFIVCVTRPGRLLWSDNTAMGHAPKWAPGGAMSHRLTDGTRRNQWGHSGNGSAQRKKNGERDTAIRPGHVITSKRQVKVRLGRNMANGVPGSTKGSIVGRRVPRGHTLDGELLTEDAYLPPAIANPGNVIRCKVGGGLMGSKYAHQNEAPFPEALADFFVRSFCPPGGLVADPFLGSGTTAAVALRNGRRFTGCDLRQSQVDLALQRLHAEVLPAMEGKPA